MYISVAIAGAAIAVTNKATIAKLVYFIISLLFYLTKGYNLPSIRLRYHYSTPQRGECLLNFGMVLGDMFRPVPLKELT